MMSCFVLFAFWVFPSFNFLIMYVSKKIVAFNFPFLSVSPFPCEPKKGGATAPPHASSRLPFGFFCNSNGPPTQLDCCCWWVVDVGVLFLFQKRIVLFRRVGPGSCPGMPGLVLEWLWLLGGPWLSVAWAVGRFSVVGCFGGFGLGLGF